MATTSTAFILGTVLVFSCLLTLLNAAPEFSGYLQKVLKNHTAHACDGEQLGITCPHKTSISILSAFYGRRVSSQNLCPSPRNHSIEDTICVSPTVMQKVLDECQDQRSCHFSINSRMFGMDPCPGTHKYLIVSYKCKPDSHRIKTVCENKKLRLQCKNNSILAIYSASYGRSFQRDSECDSGKSTWPDIECLSAVALKKVSRKCYSKQTCSVVANTETFGDPCFPGIRKQLTVSYTCVPKQLLEEVGHGSSDPFSLSDYTHGGWYKGPRLAKLHEDMMILTSSLETFAHLWGVPEKVALYFLCGVSAGLVFLLCILAPKMFIQDIKKIFWEQELVDSLELGILRSKDENEDIYKDDSSSDSSFRRLTQSYRASNNIFSAELSAALQGATEIQRSDRDEIWIPKESSPYAIQKIKSATK
ncbi:protein eva-1 homolog C [Microcaecilia unicolor]|uniref:Protein eva-1 homolog C-like n=1 Tax=Microcaecilia unicolor TaxID=1415580 RepID=A0A6P7YTJ5_9AMPH|nr:protein eva-1 homolog C-like [Microcaecilia unicolor]